MSGSEERGRPVHRRPVAPPYGAMERSSSSASYMRGGVSIPSRTGMAGAGLESYSLLEGVDASDPALADMVYSMDEHAAAAEREMDDARRGAPPSDGGGTPPSDDPQLAWIASQPRWRRPHANWLIPIVFLFALAGGVLLVPRQGLYLSVVCEERGVDRGPTHVPSPLCRTSPVGQGALSVLTLSVLLANGVFSALTAGFWSSLSDRLGRIPVTTVSVASVIIMDICTVIAADVPLRRLPFGSGFFVSGSLLEGVFGGFCAFTAMTQCYLSDVTGAGTRSRLFATLSGATFAGVSLGPSTGGLLTRASGDVTLGLWIATLIHALLLVLTLVTPESLSPARRDGHKAAAAAAAAAAADSSHSRGMLFHVREAFMGPVRSLAILAPTKVDEGAADSQSERHAGREGDAGADGGAGTSDTDPLISEASQGSVAEGEAPPSPTRTHFSVSFKPHHWRWDANLLLLSCAYFLETMCLAMIPVHIQYVQLVFDLDSEALGFFMTYLSVLRVIALGLILPLVIRVAHRPARRIALPQDADLLREEEAAAAERSTGAGRPPPTHTDEGYLHEEPSSEPQEIPWTSAQDRIEALWTQRAHHLRLIHDSHFDLRLGIGSALLSGAAHVLMALSRSQGQFYLMLSFAALGGGVGSALSSLSLSLLHRPENAARMFGAWAVLSTVSSSIVGPPLFTTVFRLSAATAPGTVFFAVAAIQFACVAFLASIHLRRPSTLAGLPPRPRRAPAHDP